MNIESLREYVLQKAGVTEGFPFGETVIVYKVNDKIFLLLPLDTIPFQFNVKCDPEAALQLREEYPGSILPGFHMNKKHWNTVIADGSLSAKQLLGFVDHSYELVSEGKKKREKKLK